MSIETFVSGIFHKIVNFFHSDKTKAVEAEIANVMPIALQFVQEFDSLLPAPGQIAVEAIVAFANKYVLPINTAALTSDDALKNAVQNLVRDVVKKNLPENIQGVANNIINAAITSAVALAHAK